MKQERTLSIEGKEYTLLISDEPQALLEAKASGRAVLGCLDTGNGEGASRDFQGIPYVVPSMEYVTEELLELILRRYLGLPWLIDETERLYIREFVKEDAENIPEEEYGKEEEIFRDPDKLEVYITALQALPTLPDDLCWLELGYHIFKPYRKNGYATEAAKAILSYSHEVLSARLCAWIEAKNKASCALAESLGMEVVKVISDQTATGWPGACLLYAEKMQ